MEDIPKNLNRELNRFGKTRNEKRSRRWTLLFVDDQGKIVSIRWVKFVIWLFGLAFLASVIFSVYFYFRQQEMQMSLQRMQASVAFLKQKNTAGSNEKTQLMIRLAAAESRLAQAGMLAPEAEEKDAASIKATDEQVSQPVKVETAPEKVSLEQETADIVSDEAEPVPNRETSGESAEETVTSAEKTNESDSIVSSLADVDDFQIRQIPGRNEVTIQFKVVNVTNESVPVSGYTFVILKPSATTAEWVSLPDSPLVDGKPSQIKKGRPFTILRFKTVRFSSLTGRDPKLFKTASVAVFSDKGDLLVEKSFPVIFKTDADTDTDADG